MARARIHPRSGWRRIVPLLVFAVLLAALALGGWWKLNQALRVVRGHTEEEFRTRLVESGRLAEIEAWAMSKMGQPVEALESDPMPPEGDVWRVGHTYAFTSESGAIEYLLVEFGGGFRHYGLLIGKVPDSHHFAHRHNNRWSENVVYYDEIPQKRQDGG